MMNSEMADDADAMTNAETVIERFGGIRPMATKMDVPVTTVQGWKKRNVIPGNRRDDVLNAARQYNIDLSDVVANQNEFAASLSDATRANDAALERQHQRAITEPGLSAPVTHEVMMNEIKRLQMKAIRKSVMASAALLAVVAIAAGLLFAVGNQKIDRDAARIAALEQQMPEQDQKPGVFGSLLNDLRNRMDTAESAITQVRDQARSLTAGNPDLAALTAKVETMAQTQGAVAELKDLVAKMQGRMDGMDDALAHEQQSSSALGQALEGVSPKELKAAAMLLGLNQFRSSLNRSEPFASDLAMLQGMVGDQDPELSAAITKLAPYAERGVLSPEGLSTELKGLTGDIVVASVQGQNVSIQDKAMARIQNLVSIKKDGQEVLGNDAQGKVTRAQKLLDAGDVDGAMAELKSLQGPSRDKAQPLIDQGDITVMAQKVQTMLSGNIAAQIKNTLNPAPLTARTGIGAMEPFQNFKAAPNAAAPQETP